VVLTAVVVAVAVVLATGIGRHHNNASPPSHHTHTTATTAKTTAPTTTVPTSPPSTLPKTLAPEPQTATTQSATYAAPAGHYTVTLTSSGACWVYAQLASTGAVVWTGELQEGQAQVLNATGQLDVQLGHANTMTATLNGEPVDYPPQFQAVFTMKFVPTTA
jgi:cytoskeletal protein RodZ